MSITFSDAVAIALNERGAKTAVRLGLPVEIGKPSIILDDHWTKDEVLVLVMALPIVMRLIARKSLSKGSDPIVVAVDELGQFIIPVLGGHRGANRLAGELASRGNGTAVITTASELAEIPAVDGLSGFVAKGDVAGLIETMLEGRDPIVDFEIEWPGPIQLRSGNGPAKVIISDMAVDAPTYDSPTVQLIPPSLVVGIGCSSDASPEDVSGLIDRVCSEYHLDRRAIAKLATIDIRANHPAILDQHLPIVTFRSIQLAQVTVPNSSAAVEAAVGTPSVAEAAALLASKSGSLVVTKTKTSRVTVAIARQKARGHLKMVGLGPGSAMLRTPAAVEAVINSEIVIGYQPYVEQCSELLSPNQLILRSPIGKEDERARTALEYALGGRSVALVCSGDPEIFAMASITFEMLEALWNQNDIDSLDRLPEVSVIPGVTAGLGGGALLGAPLGHDHAYLSLSDLLTPWETIERRIHAFGQADVVIAIYNPKSRGRTWQLPKAIEILSQYRPSTTPVAIVHNIGRSGETKKIYNLATFDSSKVDMTSLVIVGSSATRHFGDYMFTPRGYKIQP